jgi:hypothetical protein
MKALCMNPASSLYSKSPFFSQSIGSTNIRKTNKLEKTFENLRIKIGLLIYSLRRHSLQNELVQVFLRELKKRR